MLFKRVIQKLFYPKTTLLILPDFITVVQPYLSYVTVKLKYTKIPLRLKIINCGKIPQWPAVGHLCLVQMMRALLQHLLSLQCSTTPSIYHFLFLLLFPIITSKSNAQTNYALKIAQHFPTDPIFVPVVS